MNFINEIANISVVRGKTHHGRKPFTRHEQVSYLNILILQGFLNKQVQQS